jgi:pyrroline-5-carboxylate reductase
MPNIAAQFGESTTCVSFRKSCGSGPTIVPYLNLGTAIIDEKLMDAALTVLAASGTAFALRYIRSMQAGMRLF